MEKERRECTFKPKITKKHTPARRVDSNNNNNNPEEVSITDQPSSPDHSIDIDGLPVSSPSSSTSSLANMRRKLEERKIKKEASERLYQDAVKPCFFFLCGFVQALSLSHTLFPHVRDVYIFLSTIMCMLLSICFYMRCFRHQ